MTFGLSTHLFHHERVTEAHLAAVKRHGFDRIELFATRSHVDYASDAGIQAIAGWLTNTGLTAHSVHAPVTDVYAHGAPGALWSNAAADATRRARALEETALAMTFAEAIGAKCVVTHLGVPDAARMPAPDNDGGALARSLDVLAADARSRGLTLALEVIPNRWSTPDALVSRLEAHSDASDDTGELVGHGACLDVGHAHLMGGALDAVESLGGHIVTTHIHDNRGRSDDHLLPFQGGIHWSALVMALEKVGYDGVWMFEVAAPAPGADLEEMLAKTAAVRARLAKLGEPIDFETA